MNRPQTQPAKLGPLLAVLGLLLATWFSLTQTASAVFLPLDHSDLFAANSSPAEYQENSSLPPENRVWENFGNPNEITPADELNSLQLRWESHFDQLGLALGVLSYADGNPISLSDPFGLCAGRNACTGGYGEANAWARNEVGKLGMATEVVLGFTPVGVLMDIGSAGQAGYNGDMGGFGMAAVGFLPFGDFAKLGKVANGGAGLADDVMVIGRQVDTAAFRGQAGNHVLDVHPSQWDLNVNDAWVQAGIDTQTPFKMATDTKFSSLTRRVQQADGTFRHEPSVYLRELKQVRDAGYIRQGNMMLPPSP